MINARDLLYLSWIKHRTTGLYAQAIVFHPRMLDGTFVSTPRTIVLVNGEPEDAWDPIPLTPELMKKIGWEITASGVSTMAWHPTDALGKLGVMPTTAVMFRPLAENYFISVGVTRPVMYLHELQVEVWRATGKHLEVEL
jgi:hypothetical protein